MKVYEAIASAIAMEGCKVVFGVMGDANMAIYAGLAERADLAVHSARHEGGAVGMADGYQRTTGNLGVSTLTWGPGLLHAATQITIAARSGTPLVILTGVADPRSPNRFAQIDNQRFADTCGVRYMTVSSVDSIAHELAEAFYAARRHRVPVILGVPLELQTQELEWEWEYTSSRERLPAYVPTRPNHAVLNSIANFLSHAKRPVLLAGRGARSAGAGAAIARVADRVGALLATSLHGKGLFAGHSWDVGVAGAFASAPTETLLAQADFVLAFGAELGYFTSEGGLLFPEAEVARIDIKEAPDEIGLLPGLYACGDARLAAEELCRLLEQRGVESTGFRTSETRTLLDTPAPSFESPASGVDPRRLFGALSRHLPENVRIVSGVGHFWNFSTMYLPIAPAAQIDVVLQFGAIGQAFAQGIGAAAGAMESDRRIVVLEGDGSLLMQFAELETAARLHLPMTVIVVNDSGYGAEMHKLRARGLGDKVSALAAWRSPDFAQVTRALGGASLTVDTERDLEAALGAAFAADGFFLLDVRVPQSVLSDSYQKLYFGQSNRAPLLKWTPRSVR
jgi:thiamine pyrophosphate-dependent acetolactate synthase large subunit-like protein